MDGKKENLIELGLSLARLDNNRWVFSGLPGLCTTVLTFALALGFVVAPDEAEMGAVYRVLYFHAGSAIAAYWMITVLLIGSAYYLVTDRAIWDRVAHAGASVGLMFASIVLITGMIWGHSAWNRWWSWEPRLVSFLVLWLLLLSYILLREFMRGSAGERRFCSVLGIICAINVPIVIFSIKLLEHTAYLHPQVVANQGFKDPRYIAALIAATIALLILGCWLWLLKFRNLSLKAALDEVH